MSLFSKVSKTVLTKLPNRFMSGGFMKMGHVVRTPRANSADELVNSLKSYAKENELIDKFVKSVDVNDTKTLSLGHDIVDLARTQEILPTNIDMNISKNGAPPIFSYLLEKLPIVSKNNPTAIELAQDVVNHSDVTNAKYFLARFFGNPVEKMSDIAPQMQSVRKLVPNIAQDTLTGGYTMDFSKNNDFFKLLTSLLSKNAKCENIETIDKIMGIIDKYSSKLQLTCNLDNIKIADTAKLKENLEVLPQVLENLPAGNSIDISEFLTKNTNLIA